MPRGRSSSRGSHSRSPATDVGPAATELRHVINELENVGKETDELIADLRSQLKDERHRVKELEDQLRSQMAVGSQSGVQSGGGTDKKRTSGGNCCARRFPAATLGQSKARGAAAALKNPARAL